MADGKFFDCGQRQYERILPRTFAGNTKTVTVNIVTSGPLCSHFYFVFRLLGVLEDCVCHSGHGNQGRSKRARISNVFNLGSKARGKWWWNACSKRKDIAGKCPPCIGGEAGWCRQIAWVMSYSLTGGCFFGIDRWIISFICNMNPSWGLVVLNFAVEENGAIDNCHDFFKTQYSAMYTFEAALRGPLRKKGRTEPLICALAVFSRRPSGQV